MTVLEYYVFVTRQLCNLYFIFQVNEEKNVEYYKKCDGSCSSRRTFVCLCAG